MSPEPALLVGRTHSLLLDGSAHGRDPLGVVTWFGAMQGQDLASVSWSVGLRAGVGAAAVEAAIADGTVLRTWPMRGTLHLVPARDARWMLAHLGVRALAGAARRRQDLGLSEADAERAADALGSALAGGSALTRAECVAVMESAGVPAPGQRAYHLLWFASQRGITCVGPNRGTGQTFVLLDDWAPDPVALDRPAALATIAERFVRSHGPVTAHDLARWADLTVADARAGIAGARGLVQREFDGRMMVLTPALADALESADAMGAEDLPARALPGFDEYVLGYRDRTAQLDPMHEPRVVPGGNGVFAPTLVIGGRVVGTWRRTQRARSILVTARPFGVLRPAQRDALARALDAYAAFLGTPVEVRWAAPAPPTAAEG